MNNSGQIRTVRSRGIPSGFSQGGAYRFKAVIRTLFPLLVLVSVELPAAEKHHEDPTKVVTRIGAGYNGVFTLSGSLGLDEARKLNARINEDVSEWRLGGSWLFKFGIVNFNFSQAEYEGGANKQNVSLGTFVPLSAIGIEPAGWQIFPMAGLSYNEGEFLVEEQDPVQQGDYILQPGTSKGGYIGAFAFNPLGERWATLAFAGLSRGSDDYSGIWGGMGLSFSFDARQSANLYAYGSDDDFGQQEKLGLTYTYEFN